MEFANIFTEQESVTPKTIRVAAIEVDEYDRHISTTFHCQRQNCNCVGTWTDTYDPDPIGETRVVENPN